LDFIISSPVIIGSRAFLLLQRGEKRLEFKVSRLQDSEHKDSARKAQDPKTAQHKDSSRRE